MNKNWRCMVCIKSMQSYIRELWEWWHIFVAVGLAVALCAGLMAFWLFRFPGGVCAGSGSWGGWLCAGGGAGWCGVHCLGTCGPAASCPCNPNFPLYTALKVPTLMGQQWISLWTVVYKTLHYCFQNTSPWTINKTTFPLLIGIAYKSSQYSKIYLFE